MQHAHHTRRLGPTHKERSSSSSSFFVCAVSLVTRSFDVFSQSNMNQPAATRTILSHPELASNLSDADAAALSKHSDVAQAREWTLHTVEKYKKYISTLLAIHNTSPRSTSSPPRSSKRYSPTFPPDARRGALPQYWVQGTQRVMDICNDSSGSEFDDDDGDDGKGTGIPVLDLFLARSAPRPLELRVAYTARDDCPRWQVLENHFDRITVLEVKARGRVDLRSYILYTVATEMKRLEELELNAEDFGTSTEGLNQWEAQNIPHLAHLTLPGPSFCCETTVPSLRTVTLTGSREIKLLPGLLDALERRSAFTALSLRLTSIRHSNNWTRAPKIVKLTNLLRLDVGGTPPDIYCFLSSVSFPPVLPKALPRCHSGLSASPNLDRLYLHAGTRRLYNGDSPSMGMRGYVQGRERLRVDPVVPKLNTEGADHVLQFLDGFGACTLTELALDLRHLPRNFLDAALWARFFAALPDLVRLELLSPTVESRATKRAIAEQFLMALRQTHRQEAGRGTSLAWVLHGKTGDTSELEGELRDVEEVLSNHADSGGRLERLELYVVTSKPDPYTPQPVDVAQVATDGTASRLVTRAYVSRLEHAADAVVIGGGWGFLEDD
ncbi:hypothetical protein GSI_04576 [Ganoderma sinense ZZ0214-1]|uniref:F-box domain-containing protein n=1 Tax=Ganoderma sinense ZZ0214-1 TaxID=1077348 RepID=A0A2G8SHD9_9APHY|nr:hypothetical protein GSI_04576 [Ganoderma sinense ZZ0214-1]